MIARKQTSHSELNDSSCTYDGILQQLSTETSSYPQIFFLKTPFSNMDGPETADGTLVIMVCRAKHLPNRRKLDKQSPYVLLRIATTAKKTPSHFRAGQTPEWTHEIRFQLSRDRKPLLKLDVLDETRGDPTPIGATEIDCSEVFLDPANLQDGGKYILDSWYNLRCNNRPAGQIYLEMTFYPSAPVLPPKCGIEPQTVLETVEQSGFRHLAPASLQNRPGIAASVPEPQDDFRLSDPGRLDPADGVFVSGEPKKTSRFSKFKNKFRSKEPISSIWHTDKTVAEHCDNVLEMAPISPIGSLEGFEADSVPAAPLPPPHSSIASFERPAHHADALDHSDRSRHAQDGHRSSYVARNGEESRALSNGVSDRRYDTNISRNDYRNTEGPPTPDKNRYYQDSGTYFRSEPSLRTGSPSRSPNRSPDRPMSGPSTNSGYLSPQSLSRAANLGRAHRKPPPEISDRSGTAETTSIPFSATTFGLDDEPMPTKVYHLGQAVQPLTHTTKSGTSAPHRMNPNEIDPRYYAPSPSEKLARSWRLETGAAHSEDTRVQLNTESTGYLGEGKWNAKFSPSVFQRINDENSENSGTENKPPVPPKIPQGLSEMEYYVLERDNYLKDINGRRM